MAPAAIDDFLADRNRLLMLRGRRQLDSSPGSA